MDYVTPKDKAAEWGLTQRRVEILCGNGQASQGAYRLGLGSGLSQKMHRNRWMEELVKPKKFLKETADILQRSPRRDRCFPPCLYRAEVVKYIEQTNQMRDAQVDAIKTYLYLKIACGCVPLSQLFCQGAFNTLDLEQEEISASIRDFLAAHPAAAALFEYARLKNDSGEQVSEMLEKQIRKDPESIDYEIFFQKAFYGVSYTDYLFSLPMGAGKTYLMAGIHPTWICICQK